MIEILIKMSIYIYMYTKNKVQEILSLGLSLPHKERDDMAHIILQKNISSCGRQKGPSLEDSVE